ncbi:hypothetical protein Q428_12325 [Fervidicella metallireducens AeB]|uniref:PIN domain-containing protein n=1 Tax=Fervidicella metallireducens AeB TaxID=1403537 RepID=A0A017RSQ6_9CLOT|nr:PIN domain-containing protein [Fervidicella metallireducens]EYE87616.1 hypothetical protein Q428_12325 [Fervidicella metallireducens AeB]
MEIKKIEVSIPILEFKNKVTHFVSRKPTAIEWAILETIKRFGLDSQFGKISVDVDEFFKEVLKVPDTEKLVKPCIVELMELKVLEYMEYDIRLDKLKISDLKLTNEGRNLLVKGVLPAKSTDDIIELLYNPIKNEVVEKKKEKFLLDEPNENALKYFNLNIYPEQEMIDFLKELKDKNKIYWLDTTSDIQSIQELERKLKWKIEKTSLNILEDGEIRLIFNDADYNKYFSNELSSDDIKMLLKIDKNAEENKDSYDIPFYEAKNIINKVSKFLDDKNLMQEVKNMVKNGNINIINKNKAISYQEVYNIFKLNEGENKLICVFDDNIDVSLQWDAKTNNILLCIPEKFTNEEFCYLNEKKDNIYIANISAYCKLNRIELPLAFVYKPNNFDISYILNNLKMYIEKYSNNNFEMIVIKGFWQDSQQVWNDIVDKILRDNKKILKEKIGCLMEAKKRLSMIKKRDDFTWREDMLKIIELSVQNIEFATIEDVANFLKEIPVNFIVNDSDLNSKFLTILISKINFIETLDELNKFYSLLSEINMPKDIVKKVCFPSNLYNEKIILELINIYKNESLTVTLKSFTSCEESFKKLKDLEIKLKRELKIDSLIDFYNTNEFKKTIINNIEDIIGLCEQWIEIWNSIVSRIEYFEHMALHSELEKINCNTRKYYNFIKKYDNKISNRYKEVYIIDTDVLISMPHVISKFDTTDYVIIPKKVIDELDNEKDVEKSTEVRRNAQLALTELIKYVQENKVVIIEDDKDLLPDDWSIITDNSILSIALKYKTANPFIVTNNQEFKTKILDKNIRIIDLDKLIKMKSKNYGINVKDKSNDKMNKQKYKKKNK